MFMYVAASVNDVVYLNYLYLQSIIIFVGIQSVWGNMLFHLYNGYWIWISGNPYPFHFLKEIEKAVCPLCVVSELIQIHAASSLYM